MGEDGCLYVVATPIGNMHDFSPRGREVLSNCDLVACEDTRVTARLLSRFEISTSMISYREIKVNSFPRKYAMERKLRWFQTRVIRVLVIRVFV